MLLLNPEDGKALGLEFVTRLDKYLSRAGVILDPSVYVVRTEQLTGPDGWARYTPVWPNVLFVRADCLNMLLMAPHVARELKRLEQHRRYGAWYWALSSPLFDWIRLAPEAHEAEMETREALKN